MSRSSLLFFGPSAQAVSSAEASAWGRIVGTFGDPQIGLDIDTVRDAVNAMNSIPAGDQRGSIIVGPMDIVRSFGATDALLKVIEEPDPRTSRVFLWAWDDGNVWPTIRSRCLTRWCPGQRILEPSIMKATREIVLASLAGEIASVIETFNEAVSTDKDRWRAQFPQILAAAAEVLSTCPNEPKKFRLWESVRRVAELRDPSRNMMLDGLIP